MYDGRGGFQRIIPSRIGLNNTNYYQGLVGRVNYLTSSLKNLGVKVRPVKKAVQGSFSAAAGYKRKGSSERRIAKQKKKKVVKEIGKALYSLEEEDNEDKEVREGGSEQGGESR